MFTTNMSDDELLPSNDNQSKISKSSHGSSSEILKVYQVTAFKLVDGKYDNFGKLGLALICSKDKTNFNFLLYTSNRKPVTQIRISSDLELSSPKELYVSFFDSKMDNWSILFDSFDLFKDFAAKVCILKMILSKENIWFDLKIGEGHCPQDGDICEIELIVNSIKDFDISTKLFSSDNLNNKVMRVKIGNNESLPAIEKSLTTMHKSGYRIICVNYQSEHNKRPGGIEIPQNTHCIIFIKLNRFKSKVKRPNNQTTDLIDDEATLPDLNFPTNFGNKFLPPDDEEPVDKSKRAQVMDKMTKLGKSIFPNVSKPVVSSVNDEIPIRNPTYPSPAHAFNTEIPNCSSVIQPNIPTNSSIFLPQQSTQLLPFVSPINQPFVNPINQPFVNPINQPFVNVINPQQSFTSAATVAPQSSVPFSNDFNILFTETRQNNTEMRVLVNKMQDKIDRILERVDGAENHHRIVSRHLDAETLFDNLKRIFDENDSLKRDISDKTEQIDSLNKRINEIFKKNQFSIESSHDIIERNSVQFTANATELQSKILQLEEEKLTYIRSLTQKTTELSQLEVKLDGALGDSQLYRTKSVEYSDQITKLTDEIADMKLKNRSLLTDLNNLQELRNTDLIAQMELETIRKQLIETEKRHEQKVESLLNLLKESNSKLDSLKSESESELLELKQNHNRELLELKQKLKAERQTSTSRSSDLESELDKINETWEQRFNEYRQTESQKCSKYVDKNSQLLMENSALKRDLLELKESFLVLDKNQKSEIEDLKSKVTQLQRQNNEQRLIMSELDEYKNRLDELNGENSVLKKRVIEKENELKRLEELQHEFDEIVRENQRLINEKPQIYSELNDADNDERVQQEIKKIMNVIFRKIKMEFQLEEHYDGEDIISKCMAIIRDSTMAIIGNKEESEEEDEEEEVEENEESDEHESSSDESIKVEQSDGFGEKQELSAVSLGSFYQDKIDKVKEKEELEITALVVATTTPPDVDDSDGFKVNETVVNDVELSVSVVTEYHNSNAADIDKNDDEELPSEFGDKPILESRIKENTNVLEDVELERNNRGSPVIDEVQNTLIESDMSRAPNTSDISVASVEDEIEMSNDKSEILTPPDYSGLNESAMDHDNSLELQKSEVRNQPDTTSKLLATVKTSDGPKPVEEFVTPQSTNSENASKPSDIQQKAKQPTDISSDDDDEILGFLDNISQKIQNQSKENNLKTYNDAEDDLSWLNS